MTSPRPRSSPGVAMHSADGQDWTFDPGALWLEFLLTGGPGALAPFELLHHPRDLGIWLAGSRLGLSAGRLVTSASDLAEARRLRDALGQLAQDWVRELTSDPVHVAVLNQAASAPCLVPRIEPDGSRGWALPATASQALSTIARDAVVLRTGPFAHRIRECAAADCSLVFVDTSRPGTRRWCSMQRCGNRAKIKTLRSRRPTSP